MTPAQAQAVKALKRGPFVHVRGQFRRDTLSIARPTANALIARDLAWLAIDGEHELLIGRSR